MPVATEKDRIERLELTVNFLFKRIEILEKSLKLTDKALADALNLLADKNHGKTAEVTE